MRRFVGLMPVLAALAMTAPCHADGVAMSAGQAPVNVGDAAMAAMAYHEDGRYAADLQKILADVDGWIAAQAPHHRKPAIVLDIDETSLSNWPVIKADQFVYLPAGPCDALPKGPCGWLSWEAGGKAEAIPGTLAIVRHAIAAKVAVFFVTGRHEAERAATIANLTGAGYAGWSGLVLRADGSRTASAADYKAPARAAIEAQGYTIIANIGDQPSDLAGGHALKSFLLPNPFYRVP